MDGKQSFCTLKSLLLCVCCIVLLSGCGERAGLAPVTELQWQPFNKSQSQHIVRKGETLYAVAFRYDRDYRELAALNHLQSPYALHTGQVLRLRSKARIHQNPQIRARSATRHANKSREKPVYSTRGNSSWLWPVKGRIASGFAPQSGHKGINIAGKKGEVIRATASGTVAYEGNGLPGYGNLIIIKHNGNYLTAYANNAKNKVKEGQFVKAGQIIADMGIVDRKYWGVHFEIRKQGQPVNPLKYLGKG